MSWSARQVTSAAPWKKVWPAYQGKYDQSAELSRRMSALKTLAGQIGALQLQLQGAPLAP